jgi:hypothetical protein
MDDSESRGDCCNDRAREQEKRSPNESLPVHGGRQHPLSLPVQVNMRLLQKKYMAPPATAGPCPPEWIIFTGSRLRL